MIENLLESLNLLLLQHPHLLGVMRFLFWFKSWLLLGIFGFFVYLVYAENRLMAQRKAALKRKNGVFIA